MFFSLQRTQHTVDPAIFQLAPKRCCTHPLLIILLLVIAAVLFLSSCFAAEPVRIGVLAFRPKPQTQKQWQPLAGALKHAIPDRDFVVTALTFPELEGAVAAHDVDFVLTNPGHYVLLTKRIGLSAPLATLASNDKGQASTAFGGVIFCRAGNNEIDQLADIRGKTVAATSSDSFGGYQMQAYELSKLGIRVQQDASLMLTGMPHDNVVQAVLSGRADLGFVRTGVLEDMAREGRLDMSRIKIINAQNLPNYPTQLSTRLYPEWTFTSLPHIDENLARRVAAAIFTIEENTDAMRAIGIHGFVVPADYTPVAELLKALRLPPFDEIPAFTLNDVLTRYLWQVVAGLLAIGIILLLGLRLLYTRRKLQAQHKRTLEQEHKLHSLLNSMSEGAYGMDTQGNCTFVNKSFLHMLGYDFPDEIIGRHIHEVIHHSTPDGCPLPSAECRLYRAIQNNQEFHCADEAFWKKDGTKIPVEYWIQPFNEAEESGAVVTFVDIAERKQAEEAIRAASVYTRSLLEASLDPLLTISAGGQITDANAAAEQVTGISRDKLIGSDFADCFTEPEKARAGYRQVFAQGRVTDYPLVIRHVSGKLTDVLYNASVYRDEQGEVRGVFAAARDITERKRMEEQVRQLALYDPLTNLPNRRLLNDRLAQALAASRRNHLHGAVMFLDLDNFKPLNDTHGHMVGDLLLIEAGHRIKNCVRGIDTVARFGGDEFVVMLSKLDTDEAQSTLQAHAVAEKILAALSSPYQLDVPRDGGRHTTVEHHCTASIGVAMFSRRDSSHDDILKWADAAMYQAKEAGRNTVRMYRR